VLVCGALALAACGGGGDGGKAKSAPQTIEIDGSSTVFPLSEAAAEAFMNANRGARVTVAESGTGGGFGRFCRGETQVSNASRPILASEIESCTGAGIRFVEVPIAFDGLSVVVHPSNPVETATIAELKTIWEPAARDRIMNWRQVNPRWPDRRMQLFGAGNASGTFDYFTEAVVGAAKSSRTDYTPTEDDNVTVQGVANNEGAMGYFGIAYLEQNAQRLKAIAIDAGAGPVAPTREKVASGAYPLARPLFIYVNADMLRRPIVQQFMRFYLENAVTLAPRVGYVPLPAEAYQQLQQRIANAETGTAFGGEQDIGGSIAEVLARPLSRAGDAADEPPAP
jgi:phosphate transport system substrate-binding protein